jgi:glutamyl-Q tRNA(Asp) synthetase
MPEPIFRFAPSPNGDLHLGHALSAMLNHDMAQRVSGRFLVRIEDIDAARSRPSYAARILADLDWLGLKYEHPVRHQSEHIPEYRAALDHLTALGLTYPSFASRSEIRAAVADREPWPRDPDGAPVFPGLDRDLDPDLTKRRISAAEPHVLRLHMARAAALAGPLTWQETGAAQALVSADPSLWGDVILARRDAPASYHLAVVVDDAAQGVTDIVRGQDLFPATAVHRLLQQLLGLPEPRYHHHRLMLDEYGQKLSKSLKSKTLRVLQVAGATPSDIRRMAGLG